MPSAYVPAFMSDDNSTDLAKLFIMQETHNPLASNFEDSLLDSDFSAGVEGFRHDHQCSSAGVEEFRHDHQCLVQHEQHAYSNDCGDMECLSDMWENWLKMESELQTLETGVFDVSSSACNNILSTLPNFSSQTSANSLPRSNICSTASLKTSFIQPSPLPSDASPYAANKHGWHSFYENNHVNEPLETSMGSLMAPYNSSPLGVQNWIAPVSPHPLDLMAPLSPPPRSGLPLTYSKPRDSSHKMKTAGNSRNNRARKNKEGNIFWVESSTEDGYVWHKYGQKSIKNRMHPRGYFKCAHPNCPVKKQTESSSDMQGFWLITYFGEHNHSAPRSRA